mmetsp:Transcript_29694/g.30099  ORF Transcript_29694/g.30099 Transcript_29694/m.30099 type:complete len:245 (+) Transcript_29694:193-927(+)
MIHSRERDVENEQPNLKRLKLNSCEADDNKSRTLRLGNGIILLKSYVSEADQVELLDKIYDMGIKGFYDCMNESTKAMRMMNCGLGANGRPLSLSLPPIVSRLVSTANQEAQRVCPSLPAIHPDMLIVNEYKERSRLRLHDDVPTVGERGVPVVSISIGCTAEFVWKSSWSKKQKTNTVLLESGDVLIFGGRSRGIVHGVNRILPGSSPSALQSRLSQGTKRINLNCRQYKKIEHVRIRNENQY